MCSRDRSLFLHTTSIGGQVLLFHRFTPTRSVIDAADHVRGMTCADDRRFVRAPLFSGSPPPYRCRACDRCGRPAHDRDAPGMKHRTTTLALALVAALVLPSAAHAADRTVHSPTELISVLNSPYTGRVIIPADARWEVIGRNIPIHSGVQLIGERGALASRPLLFSNDKDDSAEGEFALFRVEGNDVRVEGLHLRGPEAGRHDDAGAKVDAIAVVENPEAPVSGHNIVIADNELDEWPGSGVHAEGLVRIDVPS